MREIERLRNTFVTIWDAADPRCTIDGPAYSASAHARNETKLAAFVDVLEAESRRAPRCDPRDGESERRVLASFAGFASSTLGWQRPCLEGLLGCGFREALRAFPVHARRFDPALPVADIYQAARNALTMFCLQSLLGIPVALTPAALGYSLLYPYTDNLLDDPRLDTASKRAFGRRFGDRLRGQDVTPAGDREARIFDLVGLIETQYARGSNPVVFDNLLAIHDAQMRSLALVSRAPLPDSRTSIDIAIEKGGTSVLADGYLVAGSLSPAQAECIFGLGVFLQLRDDLEDVVDDGKAGVMTVFSARGGGRLDEPTSRTLAIGAAVLDRLSSFDAAQAGPVRDIMASSLQLTIVDAAASFPARYGAPYLAALERRSPFRFASLARHRSRLSRANGSLTGLLERWLDEGTALAAPSVLEPRPQVVSCPG
jgi:hypothetical protein